MQLRRWTAAALAAGVLLAGPALAGERWWKSLDEGVAAARKSGKPILVITAWKSGI